MNILPDAKRAAILAALCEGASIRATARMVRVSRTTVLKLLVEVGELCATYQDVALRGLGCRRLEIDEIWAFVGAKARRATKASHGDIWTFTAIDAESKLLVSWLVGDRSPETAHAFMQDVAARLANRVQVTTDGHSMYLSAVENAFSYWGVDYAMLVKRYGQAPTDDQRRYSPPVCLGADKTRILGKPDPSKVSTSYVERSNLTIRMQSRRFTRLTNAFSKKAENHAHAFALFAMYYNYCRPHQTLTKARGGIHTTPAMAAGVADRVWKVEDILARMDPARPITIGGTE
jgi:IS1 family transposase